MVSDARGALLAVAVVTHYVVGFRGLYYTRSGRPCAVFELANGVLVLTWGRP